MDNHNVRWPTVEFSQDIINRFWSHVEKTDSCWIWSAAIVKGYGKFTPRNEPQWSAHRFAWFITHGVIPAGLCVCHNCPGGDNPSCVRPDHLWLGTPKENAYDMINKGTNAHGKTHWHYTTPEKTARGSRHWHASITEEVVLEMRSRYKPGYGNIPRLAREFGVSYYIAADIVSGKSWRHLL